MYEKDSSLPLSICPSSFAPTSGKDFLLSPRVLSTGHFVDFCLHRQRTRTCPDFLHMEKIKGWLVQAILPWRQVVKNQESLTQLHLTPLGLPEGYVGGLCLILIWILILLLPSPVYQCLTSPQIISILLPCAYNEDWQRAGGLCGSCGCPSSEQIHPCSKILEIPALFPCYFQCQR